jgi:hypothetical protein
MNVKIGTRHWKIIPSFVLLAFYPGLLTTQTERITENEVTYWTGREYRRSMRSRR